jgi:DNA modification methylase
MLNKYNAVNSNCQKVEIEKIDFYHPRTEIYLSDRSAEIQTITESIDQIGQQQPVSLRESKNGRYILIDGKLRIHACKNLNLNTIDAIVIEPNLSEDFTFTDLIIHNNIRKNKTDEEKLNEIIYLLGINDPNPRRDKEKRIKLISKLMGKGGCRSNVLYLEKVLLWEKENPNDLKISQKIISGELSILRAMECLDLFESEDYDFEKEKESGVAKLFVTTKMDVSRAKNLISTYNVKSKEPFTEINLQDLTNKNYSIILGDSSKIPLPVNLRVNLILTSIPYFQQVRYGDNPNEIGWEETPQEYINNIADTLMKGYDNLTQDGVFAINLYESYKNGECLGIVPLLIAELKRRGLFYVQMIIWAKPDGKPAGNNVKRFLEGFEYVIIMAKSKDYYFDRIKIKDPNKKLKATAGCSEQGSDKKSVHISNNYKQIKSFMEANADDNIIRLKISEERSQTNDSDNEFFGSFPTKLPVKMIFTFCPLGGTVWDPFTGTGTVGRCALQLGRKFIGHELYEKNIPKIIEVLGKGITEYDADSLDILNKELGLITSSEVSINENSEDNTLKIAA